MKTTSLEQEWLDVRRILLQGASEAGANQPAYQQKKDHDLLSLLSKDDQEFEKLLQEQFANEYN